MGDDTTSGKEYQNIHTVSRTLPGRYFFITKGEKHNFMVEKPLQWGASNHVITSKGTH